MLSSIDLKGDTVTRTTKMRNLRLQKINLNLGVLLQINWYLSPLALLQKKSLATEL